MRILRYIDFLLQCGLILGAVITGLVGEVLAFFVIQFMMGCLQMFGSLLSILSPGRFFRLKLIHFTLAGAYLASWFILRPALPNDLSLYLNGLPGIISIFYLYLTFKRLREDTPARGFLPHINY